MVSFKGDNIDLFCYFFKEKKKAREKKSEIPQSHQHYNLTEPIDSLLHIYFMTT